MYGWATQTIIVTAAKISRVSIHCGKNENRQSIPVPLYSYIRIAFINDPAWDVKHNYVN